jgi:ATP-dependent DNA helicase RecQ
VRIYTARFSRITPIDEDSIARVTMDSAVGVKEKLIQLSRLHIIKYIPRVRTPLIIMHTERLVESNLFISKKRYEERKGMFQKRIESIISYVKETDTCRSRLLIDYFGQEVKGDCGICDVCLKMKKLQSGEQGRRDAQKRILSLLESNGGEMKISQLETAVGDEYPFYLKMLRELIDNGDVANRGEIIRIP